MKSIKLILILFLLIIVSCVKEKNGIDIESDIIAFGDYSNMKINYYDTILIGGYNNAQNLDIDVDNDSISDIRFISEVWGSPGVGQNPCSKIWCLKNNVEILGYYKNDTSFLNRITRVLDGSNNTIEIYEYFNYSCHRQDETDTILSIYWDSFKILAKNKKDQIKLSDTFKSDSITLIDDWYGYPYTIVGYGEDTTRYMVRTFYNDCNNFPLDDIKYIGLKIRENDIVKLGWIKISIIDKFKILILESAMQK
jgi:hypothetical protein